jgi:hypothetical protein
MKTKILLTFCCLFTIVSFSQDSIFQLKDYKYRTKGYRSLEFTTSFSGDINNQKEGSLGTSKTRYFNLFPSRLSYYKIFNTDKRYHNAHIDLSSSYASQVQESDQGKGKSKGYQGSINWNFDDRFYRRNNWFFEVFNQLYGREDFTKQKTTVSNVRTTIPAINESLSLGFGKGRLEMVQDAQMALFILNDMKEQGLIGKLPEAGTVNQFAQLITEINNRRVFDFRRKRIFELTQIEKFLRDKGIASTTDIRHFTIINDNWSLAFNPSRLSGSDWYFTVSSYAELGKAKQTFQDSITRTTSDSYSRAIGIGPKFGYENYKPVNIKWQRDFRTYITWQDSRRKQRNKNIWNGVPSEMTTEWGQQQTEVYAFYGLGYYPNNRTKLNAGIDVKATKFENSSAPHDKQLYIRPSFGLSADYFVGYRTRLYADLSAYHEYRHFEYVSMPSLTTNNFHTYFSVSISHYFF